MKKIFLQFNKAFTLAEVLITLVIIGVIAALTIPNVINNTKKQEYVSKLKKAYSTLAQVTNTIIFEDGTPRASYGGWATGPINVFTMYKKHLSSAKECNVGANIPDCLSQIQNGKQFKCLNGVDCWRPANPNLRSLILADGTQVLFEISVDNNCTLVKGNTSNVCYMMIVDVNGAKAPNQIGRDVFMFNIKEDGLHPAGCERTGVTCSDFNCTCKVLQESAMNY